MATFPLSFRQDGSRLLIDICDSTTGLPVCPIFGGTGGVIGATGPAGADGPPGPVGLDGATGATGAAGIAATLTYAYIYNTTGQVVAIEADVPFSNNGLISPTIIHPPGSTSVTVTEAGVYGIEFSVSGTEPNQFTVFVNGVAVPGSTYGSGAGTQQNTGSVIVNLAAGDVITLRNHTSSSAVTLATPIGGTAANANASLTIIKLA